MASERKFIQKALVDFSTKQFLQRELTNAGVSSIEIQKTPVATRIAISVKRPGLVVGKKGQTIRDITQVLQTRYGIENPQIEVIEVQAPSLDAKLMAEKIGRQLEIKGNAKTAMRFALREIIAAGATGAELRAAGKLVGKGGKAKSTTIRAGFLKKSGEEAKKMSIGHYTAYLKAGAVGITVKIAPPGTMFSDKVDLSTLTIPPAVEALPEEPVEKKEEKKIEKKKRAPRKKTTRPKVEQTHSSQAEQAVEPSVELATPAAGATPAPQPEGA